MPLQQWLSEQVFPQEDKLTGEHIHWFTKLAILEYLAGGITAAFDMYFEPEAVASAATEMGFRITMCGGVNNFGTTPAKMAEFYEKYRNYSELVDYKLGFHSEYTNSTGNLTEIVELGKQYKAPVFTHMSETLSEHNECIGRHGKTPAALFADLGLNMTMAMNMFLRQAIRNQGIPFEISRVPNSETAAAMLEADRISRDPNVKGYTDLDELFKDLRS